MRVKNNKPERRKLDPDDCSVSGMNGNANLAGRYLIRLVRSFRAAPENALMIPAVKIAHLAELAGVAVAVRARICRAAGREKTPMEERKDGKRKH